ncbi:hypothetical protein [Cohnella candidum]|uniref:TniQ family protein n=1 Tax=Cohnella candidum TaxID=2674991 RepID=A0A3G3JY70_9BACL|nr:hypothetical protein [Cohnella candidum]AYQ72459.1 hypothetical protein EAV92_07685 [Cohnella candidum]
MNIAWRREWIHPYETPWSVFEKLILANRVERNELLKTFGSEGVQGIKNHIIGDRWRELRELRGFDSAALRTALDYDLTEHNHTTTSNIVSPLHYCKERLDSWFAPYLRWCEKCMNNGYHSWLHQFIMVRKCPNHEEYLLDACPGCRNQIPFLISNKQLSDPFTCKCGYRLADFTVERWQTWNTPIQSKDNMVELWLSDIWKSMHHEVRWLFIPNHVDLQLLTKPSQVKSTAHWPILSDKNELEYLRNEKMRERAFFENRNVFMSVDRYIRKKILKQHKNCIENMLELKKGEGAEFPPICPYAYAYVFWRKSILKIEHFYRTSRSDGIAPPKLFLFEYATKLIQDELKYYRSRFMEYSSIPIDRKEAAVNWLLNRITAEFCINFFNEWLRIAQEGAAEIKVPNWNEIHIMKANCFPRIAFKFNGNDPIGQIEFSRLQYEKDKSQCIYPSNNNKERRMLNKMKSFHPLKVAMKIMDNPSNENKKLKEYVDQYVNRLAF